MHREGSEPGLRKVAVLFRDDGFWEVLAIRGLEINTKSLQE